MRIEDFPPRPCPLAEFAMDQMTLIFHRLPPSRAEGAAVPSCSCCGQMNPGCPPSEWLLCLRSDYVSGAMKAVLFLRLHHRHPAIVAFSPFVPASITAPHIPGVGQSPQLWASLCRRKHFLKIFFQLKTHLYGPGCTNHWSINHLAHPDLHTCICSLALEGCFCWLLWND